jgi:hypothetical protein
VDKITMAKNLAAAFAADELSGFRYRRDPPVSSHSPKRWERWSDEHQCWQPAGSDARALAWMWLSRHRDDQNPGMVTTLLKHAAAAITSTSVQ